jgi:uncharacterized membrane protein YphA (DoxX/SURF4 family)
MANNTNFPKNRRSTRYTGLITTYFRVALGLGFLSAVADRFGLWGPAGAPTVSSGNVQASGIGYLAGVADRFGWWRVLGGPHVAWGNFQNFLAYAATLNPWFPASWIPAIGWIVTICEICFGLALIVGFHTRSAAVLSGFLTLAFAIGMLFGLGLKAPLNYSVFVISAGSFLLAEAEGYPWSLDSWRQKTRVSMLHRPEHEHRAAA